MPESREAVTSVQEAVFRTIRERPGRSTFALGVSEGLLGELESENLIEFDKNGWWTTPNGRKVWPDVRK